MLLVGIIVRLVVVVILNKVPSKQLEYPCSVRSKDDAVGWNKGEEQVVSARLGRGW